MNGTKYKKACDTERLILVSDLVVTFQENSNVAPNTPTHRYSAPQLSLFIDDNDKVTIQSNAGTTIGSKRYTGLCCHT